MRVILALLMSGCALNVGSIQTGPGASASVRETVHQNVSGSLTGNSQAIIGAKSTTPVRYIVTDCWEESHHTVVSSGGCRHIAKDDEEDPDKMEATNIYAGLKDIAERGGTVR